MEVKGTTLFGNGKLSCGSDDGKKKMANRKKTFEQRTIQSPLANKLNEKLFAKYNSFQLHAVTYYLHQWRRLL